jgi:hypothetical protein
MISTAFRLDANRIKHFLDCPHMVSDSGFHGGGDAQCLVDANEGVKQWWVKQWKQWWVKQWKQRYQEPFLVFTPNKGS